MGSRKGLLGYVLGKKAGGAYTERVVDALHIPHIPTAQEAMSTVLVVPQLRLTLPYAQAVLHIAVPL